MKENSPTTDSARPALAFFAPHHRHAKAETRVDARVEACVESLVSDCRAQGWLVSCRPLAREAIAEAFAREHAIVGWCSPAILIRSVRVSDKHRDSPVLCFPPVAEGQPAVLLALLGWHHGGRAVALALEQAWRQNRPKERLLVVGGSATEAALGFSLEDLPQGWVRLNETSDQTLGDTDKVLKAIARAAPRESPCEIVGEAFDGFPPQKFFDLANKGKESNKKKKETSVRKPRIAVGVRRQEGADLHLVPRCLAVGVGCVRGASCEEIADLVERCLTEADVESAGVAGIASIALKRSEHGLLQFAARRGLPLRFFSSAQLSSVAEQHGLARNEAVERATGAPNVAEAAALALASSSARDYEVSGQLVLAKRKSSKVTCALAASSRVLVEAALAGQKNGVLTLVGLGPGASCERTAAAARVLREAECVVGYEGYVELLEEGETRAELCRSAIGSEEERCRRALALAREGKRTVLLASGDAGVYGLATLVWQILAEDSVAEDSVAEDSVAKDSADLPPVEVRQVCGVSAMHALAARLGAPLADDFCAVSLSDVMTAEETILQRIEAAARGDFVVALYNPQSRTRRRLLPRALALLQERRPAETPVACGRNIGRKDESVTVARLQDFHSESVDMHSVVIIGNSKTKLYASPYGTRLYTPRGYRLAAPRRAQGACEAR